MPQKADCWFSDDETDNYFLRVDITDLTLLSFFTYSLQIREESSVDPSSINNISKFLSV